MIASITLEKEIIECFWSFACIKVKVDSWYQVQCGKGEFPHTSKQFPGHQQSVSDTIYPETVSDSTG